MATLVEGDPKAPFSIATTRRCRGVLLLSLDCSTLPLIPTLYCWVLSKEASGNVFESLIWLDLGLNPGLLAHWRTLYRQANAQILIFCTVSSGSLFLPSQILYSFYDSLLHSLIMWLTVSSLSPHNQHLLLYYVTPWDFLHQR